MLSKGKMNILLGLCLVSLTSVGFSSWIIVDTSPSTENVSGNIAADNVINSREYISYVNCNIFKYGSGGFAKEINGVNYYVKNGSIDLEYSLYVSKCKADNIDINIDIIAVPLTGDNINIFNNSAVTVTSEIKCNNTTVSSTYTDIVKSNSNYTITISSLNSVLSGISTSTTQLKIKINFAINSINSYTSNFYKQLYDDQSNLSKMKFVVIASANQ